MCELDCCKSGFKVCRKNLHIQAIDPTNVAAWQEMYLWRKKRGMFGKQHVAGWETLPVGYWRVPWCERCVFARCGKPQSFNENQTHLSCAL